MLLERFILVQLVFDAIVVMGGALLLVWLATRRRAVVEPPEWHQEFVQVARDLLVATEPLLETLGSRVPARPPPASEFHLPGEVRLRENVAAARSAVARGTTD
jgi:hypothetical protein